MTILAFQACLLPGPYSKGLRGLSKEFGLVLDFCGLFLYFFGLVHDSLRGFRLAAAFVVCSV